MLRSMPADDFYYIYRLKNSELVNHFVKFEDLGLKDYKDTWDYQEIIFDAILKSKLSSKDGSLAGEVNESGRMIFVEHPHVFTLGKSGSEENLLLDFIQLKAKDASYYRIDRGGDITYHGPGQIVGYPIFDLEKFGLKLKEYIHLLEELIIRTIKEFGITGDRLDGATGVWIDKDIPGQARKICAIGVRASRYVTMHGFAFNVNTDLNYFDYINPCGFTDKGVTSLQKETGKIQDIEFVKEVVKKKMKELFDIEWV